MAQRSDFQARLAGTGGQGLGLAGRLLADALVAEGLRVAQSQTYEPTSRGGTSRSDLVVSPEAPDYPLVTALDFLLLLHQSALEDAGELLLDGALIVIDDALVTRPPTGRFTTRALPLMQSARMLGNPRVANMIGLGALVTLGAICPFDGLEGIVRRSTPAKFRELNQAALREGRRLAAA